MTDNLVQMGFETNAKYSIFWIIFVFGLFLTYLIMDLILVYLIYILFIPKTCEPIRDEPINENEVSTQKSKAPSYGNVREKYKKMYKIKRLTDLQVSYQHMLAKLLSSTYYRKLMGNMGSKQNATKVFLS